MKAASCHATTILKSSHPEKLSVSFATYSMNSSETPSIQINFLPVTIDFGCFKKNCNFLKVVSGGAQNFTR